MPGNQIQIFGPAESGDALKDMLGSQMGGSFFPVSIDGIQASVKYTAVSEESFETLGIPIDGLYALHPGRTLMYKLILGGKSIVYAPDNEILPESVNPALSGEALRLARFAEGCDTLIHDCTYNLLKYRTRRGWGHSCPEYLAAVAADARVKRTILFHHDPDSADEEVEAIHRDFITTLKERGADLEVEIGAEGDAVPV